MPDEFAPLSAERLAKLNDPDRVGDWAVSMAREIIARRIQVETQIRTFSEAIRLWEEAMVEAVDALRPFAGNATPQNHTASAIVEKFDSRRRTA